jgi:acyl-coenzyme A synthetase/AMP-(fatty) acid ligase
MRVAVLILVACLSAAHAEIFECAPTLTRVLVRTGEDWKEVSSKPAEHSTIRELRPEERRTAGKTWGLFVHSKSSPTEVCTRYDTIITCGIPGNTLDFNTRTGRYVRAFFATFLSRDSSEIFLEAGRCAKASQ